MTPASRPTDPNRAFYGWLAVSLLNIALGRWWPGTLAAKLSTYASIAYFTIWFGLKIRKGIVTRRPHWTRESWLRYARLAAMPVVAVAIVLYMSSDLAPALGSRGSAIRIASIAVLLVLLVFGGGGLAVAINWMTDGEPSQQFTRRRWFQRQKPDVAAR